jgi:hypothetical protein
MRPPMTPLSRPVSRRISIRFRLLSVSLAAAALAGLAAVGLACRDFGNAQGTCIGGVLRDGVCEGKCTPDKCIEQNTCVDNRCALLCASHGDCLADGVQSCLPAKEDGSGADILVCQPSGRPAGMGASCFSGTECAALLACPDGGGCRADQCGGQPDACVPDGAACEGKEGCTAGKCPNGDACRVGCAEDCAPWLECEAAGEGDVDAYCTRRDCETDDDCIAGFYCGVVRTPFDVCGPSCEGGTCTGGDLSGQPCDSDPPCQKGNDALCGETSEPCKAPGEGGATFFEGSRCLLRRSCLKRGPAVPCATDTDCSRSAGQQCAELGGERRCTAACVSDFECQSDAACDLEEGACIPRFGAWIGKGGFCEPCVSDEDCGTNGTTVACAQLLGGGRACFDFSYPTECTTDADCPLSPGGVHGACLDEGEAYTPDSPLYHRCSLPIDPDTKKASCW